MYWNAIIEFRWWGHAYGRRPAAKRGSDYQAKRSGGEVMYSAFESAVVGGDGAPDVIR